MPPWQPVRPAFFAELTVAQQKQFVALEQKLLQRNLPRDIVHALLHVPRHHLIPARVRRYAYADRPLEIGWAQTISQPSLVAAITCYAAPAPGMRVLEVGCGSGYQAAIVAQLGAQIFALERIAEHVRRAQKKLWQLGYTNINVVHADGHCGWSSNAPYQAIIVSAAAEHIPCTLLEQLDEGGRLIVPVGKSGHIQRLVGVTKRQGSFERQDLGRVQFVPLDCRTCRCNGA